MAAKLESLPTQIEHTRHHPLELQNEVHDNTPSYLRVHTKLYEYCRFDCGVEMPSMIWLYYLVYVFLIGVVLELLLIWKICALISLWTILGCLIWSIFLWMSSNTVGMRSSGVLEGGNQSHGQILCSILCFEHVFIKLMLFSAEIKYSLRPNKYETFGFWHEILCSVVLWVNEEKVK